MTNAYLVTLLQYQEFGCAVEGGAAVRGLLLHLPQHAGGWHHPAAPGPPAPHLAGRPHTGAHRPVCLSVPAPAAIQYEQVHNRHDQVAELLLPTCLPLKLFLSSFDCACLDCLCIHPSVRLSVA